MSEKGPNETIEEFEKRCEVDAITVAFLLLKAAQFASEDGAEKVGMTADEWGELAPTLV